MVTGWKEVNPSGVQRFERIRVTVTPDGSPASAAQLAAGTKRIKLGSGGVMLPKHCRA